MWSQRISSAQALDSVRRCKWLFRSIAADFLPIIYGRTAAREQIWPNAGFQEQLSIFEMCRYAPSPTEGIYVRWRQQMDRRLQEQGISQPGQR